MDIIQLFQDFGINYATEGYKYCRPGWVNVECPFCTGNPGPHLGYNLQSDYFNCWRCGGHPMYFTLSKLLGVNTEEIKKICRQYGSKYAVKNTNNLIIVRKAAFKLPTNTSGLKKKHKLYLESRNFDANYLEKEWGLLGTGNISQLKNEGKLINYKNRIIIPFFWNGKMVSFDSRDITGNHVAKYMACPKELETIEHKHILYGNQSKWKETGIGVEGPTDVWRFGPRSCALSGIQVRPEQIRVISKIFKRFAVVFDGNEIQAKRQADKLVAELKFRGVDSFRVDINGDPGEMDQSEANYLVKQLTQ